MSWKHPALIFNDSDQEVGWQWASGVLQHPGILILLDLSDPNFIHTFSFSDDRTLKLRWVLPCRRKLSSSCIFALWEILPLKVIWGRLHQPLMESLWWLTNLPWSRAYYPLLSLPVPTFHSSSFPLVRKPFLLFIFSESQVNPRI